MNILIVLIPISLVLLAVAAAVFIWAVRRGQFDDLETPALDILAEDREPESASEPTTDPRPEPESRPIPARSAEPAQPPHGGADPF